MKPRQGFSCYSDVFASEVMSREQKIEGPEELARVVSENRKKAKLLKLESAAQNKAKAKADATKPKSGDKPDPRTADDQKKVVRRGKDSAKRGEGNQTNRNVTESGVAVEDTKDDRYRRPGRVNQKKDTGDRKSRNVKSSVKATSDRHGRSDIDWNDEVQGQNDFEDESNKFNAPTRERGQGRGRYNNRRFNRGGRDSQTGFRENNEGSVPEKKVYIHEKFEDYENLEDEPLERLVVEETAVEDEIDILEEGYNKTKRDSRPRGDFKRGFSQRGESGFRGEFRPRGESRQRGEFVPRGEFRRRGEFVPRGEYRRRGDFVPRGDSRRRGDVKRTGEGNEFEGREDGQSRQFRDYNNFQRRTEADELEPRETKQFVFHEVDFPTMDQAYH